MIYISECYDTWIASGIKLKLKFSPVRVLVCPNPSYRRFPLSEIADRFLPSRKTSVLHSVNFPLVYVLISNVGQLETWYCDRQVAWINPTTRILYHTSTPISLTWLIWRIRPVHFGNHQVQFLCALWNILRRYWITW